MATHRLRYIGRVEFSFLDYVNLCLSVGLVGLAVWSGSLVLGAMLGGFAAVVVVATLYGARVMGRIQDLLDEDASRDRGQIW